MGKNVVMVGPADNVAVAIRPIKQGEAVEGAPVRGIVAAMDVPRNHKVSIAAIRAGEKVVKYGEPIGLAGRDIAAGEWVHSDNLKDLEG